MSTINKKLVHNEKIECICCYNQNVLAIDAFIKCKAEPKHLICQRCYTDWGSGSCFFCNPLDNNPIYVRVPTEITSEIVVNINERRNAEVNITNIDLSMNDSLSETSTSEIRPCFNEEMCIDVCNSLCIIVCFAGLFYVLFLILLTI